MPLISQIHKILLPHKEIIIAYLYGSRAKHTHQPTSDIDIGVLLGDKVNITPLYPFDLSHEVHINLSISNSVDIRILNQRNIRFLYRVIRDGKLILCRDEDTRITFETSVIKAWLDIQPYDRQYTTIMENRILASL